MGAKILLRCSIALSVACACNALLVPVQKSYFSRSFAPHKSSTLYMAADQSPPYQGPSSKPILDRVKYPEDMNGLNLKELKQLAHELRWETIEAVSKTGGHLSSSLGVIELTVALHYVFKQPEDKICFDVSHQVYPHKILTGRRERMPTLRKYQGLSGFAKMSESDYDSFGAGHSSTSISAALGMSEGKRLVGKNRNNCIAVIGDGAITGGMAYEAMNNAGYLRSRMIVVLNDNGQVSLPTGTPSVAGNIPAGALSAYTSRLLSSKSFANIRDVAKGLSRLMPDPVQNINAKLDEYARGIVSGGGTLFEELGFYYIGPVDGHDLDNLVPILENLRDSPSTKPVLLHIKTEKGFGYPPAMAAADKMHGVAKFDVATGIQQKPPPNPDRPKAYTTVFANALIDVASEDRTVVGITAAMPGGTGMDIFGRRFPRRTYDVGIAEQHAVTFAAGLACEGVKPFVAVYSTFLQRGYDQVVHDVVLQNLPVRFILDRAGLVGNDGATHHGSFDLTYLGSLPDMVIMAPSNELELMHMVQTAYHIDHMASAVRYPRGAGYGLEQLNSIFNYQLDSMPARGSELAIGKGRVVRSASQNRPHRERRVAILAIGSRVAAAVEAARQIELEHPEVGVTVADARFLKPLDTALIDTLVADHGALVTVEENSIGGFGAHVTKYVTDEGRLDDGKLKFRSMFLPDLFIEAGTQAEQLHEARLSAKDIADQVRRLVARPGAGAYSVSAFGSMAGDLGQAAGSAVNGAARGAGVVPSLVNQNVTKIDGI